MAASRGRFLAPLAGVIVLKVLKAAEALGIPGKL
jgi:hypothetical protein